MLNEWTGCVEPSLLVWSVIGKQSLLLINCSPIAKLSAIKARTTFEGRKTLLWFELCAWNEIGGTRK